jgi:hypothetical protein
LDQILEVAMADLPISDSAEARAAQRKQREREKVRARREQRVTYDIPPGLREQVRALVRGEVDLARYKEPSRSPRYVWNLRFPASLLGLIRRHG